MSIRRLLRRKQDARATVGGKRDGHSALCEVDALWRGRRPPGGHRSRFCGTWKGRGRLDGQPSLSHEAPSQALTVFSGSRSVGVVPIQVNTLVSPAVPSPQLPLLFFFVQVRKKHACSLLISVDLMLLYVRVTVCTGSA